MSTSTLFLDFDGVLHSMSGYHDQPFCRLPLLEEVLVNADVDIVISSSWRFQYSLDELKGKLGQLGSKVVGATGEAHVGPYPRFNEIFKYAEIHQISNWRANTALEILVKIKECAFAFLKCLIKNCDCARPAGGCATNLMWKAANGETRWRKRFEIV